MSHPDADTCRNCGCHGRCEEECEGIPDWFKFSEEEWCSNLNGKGLCPCCRHDERGDENKPDKGAEL